MVDISIVLITWNAFNYLKKLLESIKLHSKNFCYEIIIVDNNSRDGTRDFIKKQYPEILLVENRENLGVARARNQGMKLANGKYIMILDVDMELIENSIFKIYRFMEENQDCGLIAAKLIYSSGELQYSCKTYPTIFSLLARRLDSISLVQNSSILKKHLMQNWDHNDIKEVDYVVGACQLIRRQVINTIGYYDDNIFYGPEDLDYCLRVWRAGWKVIYYPYTKIIHHEQRITKKIFISKITLKHIWGLIYIYYKYRGKLSR